MGDDRRQHHEKRLIRTDFSADLILFEAILYNEVFQIVEFDGENELVII